MVGVLATSKGLGAKVTHVSGLPRLCDRAPIKSLDAKGLMSVLGVTLCVYVAIIGMST